MGINKNLHTYIRTNIYLLDYLFVPYTESPQDYHRLGTLKYCVNKGIYLEKNCT